METLIQNAFMTPDGTIIKSAHRHEYVTHIDENGLKYLVDGGLDYCRRTTTPIKEDLTLYKEDTHLVIREKYLWGTFGKNFDEPFRYVRLKDMETAHINAILDPKWRISPTRKEILETELLYRICGSEEKITC